MSWKYEDRGRSFDHAVLLRPWEYKAYSFIDDLIYGVWNKLFKGKSLILTIKEKTTQAYLKFKFGERITKLGEKALNCEYYLLNDGKIKIRKYTGNVGMWKTIDGKSVKVKTSVNPDTIKIINYPVQLRASDLGYFDEDLNCYVESKAQYRQKMEEKGLVPLEKNLYGKSRETIKKDRIKNLMQKTEKKRLSAFKEGCNKAESEYGRVFD